MEYKLFTWSGQKRMVLFCMCLAGMLVLQGCGYIDTWIEKWTHGDMAGVTTNCKVLSVDGTLGAHNYICKNNSHTYIYQNNAICDYHTMEKLIELDTFEEIECMACNDDVLYYSIYGRGLYCYKFSEGNSTLITNEYTVVGMKAYGDDIFISQRIKEGDPDTSVNASTDLYTYELIYYHKDEAGININEWAAENTEKRTTDNYKIYEFEGYDIVADQSLGEDLPRIVYIENADGFQYSCYGYNTYSKIQGEYIRLSKDVKSRFHGKEIIISKILEASDYDAGLAASQIGFCNDRVYILAQYSRGTGGYRENPTKDFKVLDAFFEFLPETGECEMVYKVQEGEQIAGFSYKKNCLYLLRNDGVYQYDLETGSEKCILENKEYERLAFEYFDDKLFIFKDVSIDSPVELLFVVE